MKKILFYITPFALLLFACKEQIPVGLDLNGNTSSVDTTYLAAPETPLLKRFVLKNLLEINVLTAQMPLFKLRI